MMETFQALVTNQVDKKTIVEQKQLSLSDLPDGDVLVRVDYSSLNYKDGLAVTGLGKIIRQFPLIPGIDLAGTVVDSQSPEFQAGDAVVLTGWGVGESHSGGYAQMARVKADWLVPLPEGMASKQAMAIGTAGFTAMMCVEALEANGCLPDSGKVIVTGASGGVGGIAVAILSHLGYEVTASTGRSHLSDYLRSLGANQVINRDEIAGPPERPLSSGRFAGAIDSVGGDTLAQILTMMKYGGSVTAVGLAGGPQLNTTVLPFILRGVKLLGIDSVMAPKTSRLQTWQRLATDLPLALLETMSDVIPLADVPRASEKILAGQVRGRIIVDVNAQI